MQRLVGFLGSMILVSGAGLGQIIENPVKPLVRSAGRVLALTEVWRITDDAREFFFTGANDLGIAGDGSVFLAESNQFLKFSPEGRFLKNLYKKGQGPGEWQQGAFRFWLQGGDIFIHDPTPNRCWRTDLDGQFKASIDISELSNPDFIGAGRDFLLFTTFDWKAMFTASGYVDLPRTVWRLDAPGGTPKKVLTLPCRSFKAPRSLLFGPLVIKLSPDGGALYTVAGWDYRIDVHDAATGAAIKSFTRSYPKVKLAWTDEQEKQRRESGTPRYEFAPDINNLYPLKDGVWVETSADDKDKGRLYDVFDEDGRFIDSFFLGPGKKLMAVQGGHVYCQEKRPDETFMMVKYRIGK